MASLSTKVRSHFPPSCTWFKSDCSKKDSIYQKTYGSTIFLASVHTQKVNKTLQRLFLKISLFCTIKAILSTGIRIQLEILKNAILLTNGDCLIYVAKLQGPARFFLEIIIFTAQQDRTHLVLCNVFHKCSAVMSRAKYYKKVAKL